MMSILLLIFKTVIDLAIKLSLSGKEPPSGNKNSFCDLPKTVVLLVVFPDICIVKRPARKGAFYLKSIATISLHQSKVSCMLQIGIPV